jgi:hypothetical protein
MPSSTIGTSLPFMLTLADEHCGSKMMLSCYTITEQNIAHHFAPAGFNECIVILSPPALGSACLEE